ncbi:JAB N-terminal domain-containing protein [Actinoplanes sp. CA-015351]|uniref:JAB N-terminal domain-containing protein n=1 Tax=Actinoplanes sp. CA-015351 TaxID=3239897 RepID=UPI003D97369A
MSDEQRKRPSVRLYKDDVRSPVDSWPLVHLLRLGLGDRIPRSGKVSLTAALLERPDPTPATGDSLINLNGNLGVFHIMIFVDEEQVYTGEHPVRELLEPVIQRLAKDLDPETRSRWFFDITQLNEGRMAWMPIVSPEESDARRLPLSVRRVEGEGAAELVEDSRSLPVVILRIRVGRESDDGRTSEVVRPAPRVEGAVDVDLDRPRSVPFSIRKAAEPELPLLETANLGVTPGRRAPITVVLRPEPHRQLSSDLNLSFKMEEGGFFAGQIFRVAPGEDRYVVLIERVLPAKHTGASSVHFTFTVDSFQEMTRELTGGPSRLVGWYHTHLFPADHHMDLSSVDVKLHHSTFRQPWQVAGLINLTRSERKLRFFAATEDDMERCALWVTDERDGHGATRLDLGDRDR